MDIVNKAIAKASDLANEAAWNAQHKVKISTEEKRLDDLQSRALQKRAEIGEEMFKLWQAHKLPPSQLDGLFYELQDIIDAVMSSRENLEALKNETYEQAIKAQTETITSYAAAVPAPPQIQALPAGQGTAAPTVIDSAPAVELIECGYCHAMVRADRNFCGRCGHKLAK